MDIRELTQDNIAGARYFRCALQVNPFDYLQRYSIESPYTEEASYNEAIVEALLNQDVQVIAITDHFRIDTSESLTLLARSHGITVFPAFEAVSKEGVHLLILCDPHRTSQDVERCIGNCGIQDSQDPSPIAKISAEECFRYAREQWNAVCIAAHVASKGGLLYAPKGRARATTWKSDFLLACSLPGASKDVPENLHSIINNKDPEYKRKRPIAILNAQDVRHPSDLQKQGTSCWVKMTEVSVEALRQAFLDPISRIRLASDPPPLEHSEIVSIGWEGGFLDGQSLSFNSNLNVLVGGRGTGKSTILESIRYVLDIKPLGDEATRSHANIIHDVLGRGTKITLILRTHRPVISEYMIQRRVPDPPKVLDDSDILTDLKPRDIQGAIEVYGQHEISELARDKKKLTNLLSRFVSSSSDAEERKKQCQRELKQLRETIIQLENHIETQREKLQPLPGLNEELRKYKKAGIEALLLDKANSIEEIGIIEQALIEASQFNDIINDLDEMLPLDLSFLADDEISDYPGSKSLLKARRILQSLSSKMKTSLTSMKAAANDADEKLEVCKTELEKRKDEVDESISNIIKGLSEERNDADVFIDIKVQVEKLKPIKTSLKKNHNEINRLKTKRKALIRKWKTAKQETFEELDKAAKSVSIKLAKQVRVKVVNEADLSPLEKLIREISGGRLYETINTLTELKDFSISEFVTNARKGTTALIKQYSLTEHQAEKIVNSGEELFMQLEELDLPAETNLQLNTAGEGERASWQGVDKLSTGQRATAVLLLLLLESDAPLIVDQPEDDLDNRFISGNVIPRLRQEKQRRQFIVASHNANIPVLADAELIAGLVAMGEGKTGQCTIPREMLGSIDLPSIQELIEEVLEGGKEAFETRRLKYGF